LHVSLRRRSDRRRLDRASGEQKRCEVVENRAIEDNDTCEGFETRGERCLKNRDERPVQTCERYRQARDRFLQACGAGGHEGHRAGRSG
jgi:hypothetical protein